jgi:hypothetical protein
VPTTFLRVSTRPVTVPNKVPTVFVTLVNRVWSPPSWRSRSVSWAVLPALPVPVPLGRGIERLERLMEPEGTVARVVHWEAVTVTVIGSNHGLALDRRGALMSRAKGMIFVNILVS